MLLILISIHFIVRPCLYSFIVISFVLKGLIEKEASYFFRVSYYSKAGIDNTCIMIKKNAYVLLKTSGRHMQHVWIRIIFREVFKE